MYLLNFIVNNNHLTIGKRVFLQIGQVLNWEFKKCVYFHSTRLVLVDIVSKLAMKKLPKITQTLCLEL